MISTGERAPEFELPGTGGDEIEKHRLSAYVESGPVILLFYPFDFSPVCTEELCGFRDAEWLSFTENVDVFGISTDACYAHRRFIGEYDLNFPLLSDTTGEVSAHYGIAYDEWEHHRGVPRRSVFIIDSDQTVTYVWSTDDAYESPDIEHVNEKLREISTEKERGDHG